MRPRLSGIAALPLVVLPLIATTPVLADDLPPALNEAFLNTTPSLAWQGRMPSASEMGAFLNIANPASGGFPEFRNANVIGGGSFANASGYMNKINAYWLDPKATSVYRIVSLNVVAFDTVQHAVDAIPADATSFQMTSQALPAQGSIQRWNSVAAASDSRQTISWAVNPDPMPTLVRVVCSLYGPKPPQTSCPIDKVDALALQLATRTTPPAALAPQVLADLPMTVPGLQAQLAVQQSSPAVWETLQPTPALRTAIAGTNSTVLQYAPQRATPIAISAIVTPLGNPATAKRFIREICSDALENTICKRKSVTTTASGITIDGQMQVTLSKRKKMISEGIQATGAGVLVFIDCRDGRAGMPLSAADAALCKASVPALLDAIFTRQQQ